jgi:transcription elongation factor Elf1
MQIQIVSTDARTLNHATGETAPRHQVRATCACPSCGDVDVHPGVSHKGAAELVCAWCGHKWELAHELDAPGDG